MRHAQRDGRDGGLSGPMAGPTGFRPQCIDLDQSGTRLKALIFGNDFETKQMFVMFVVTMASIFILAAGVGSDLKARRPEI